MNYGDENDVKRLTGGTVINGIEVGLPEAVTSKLDAEILKLYSKTGLAEMVLMHQLYDGNILAVNFNSLEDVTRISWTFKEEGYRIAAFRGRHNAVKPAEISRRLYSEA